jgi:threonine dehydrogenase-like Zn-dependent dehydrogenase
VQALSDTAARRTPTRRSGAPPYGGFSFFEEHPMHRTAHGLITAALATGLGAFQVHAEPANPSLPMATESGPVTVISGGVDLDEAERMKRAAGQYPLRVVFSVPGGNYAVPQEFTLLQSGQTMLKIQAAGPWLLIDVPPGAYTMQARVEDHVFDRAVTVRRRGSTVHWVVPDGNSAI